MKHTVSAVIVCAGNSMRMGDIDKIFVPVASVPVIAYTLTAFENAQTISDIIVVTKPENFDKIKDIACRYNITKPLLLTKGGAIRAESVLNGVLKSQSDYVAISDGARPLILSKDIDAVSLAAFEVGSAALGVKMTDTVKKQSADNIITSTVDRTDLVRIQTPQTFGREKYVQLLTNALALKMQPTDDCSVFEHFNEKVKIVYSSNENIKITEKKDIDIFAKLIGATPVTIGHGYDVHRLVKDRDLILCGEKIDFELGLLGHSDADVATHALMDAMLGAAAMGDIGRLFPDTDDKYKGADSIVLLKRVCELVFKDYTFGNCDITIIAQKPKLLPHIPKMKQNIANALGVSDEVVNVKATTEEKLGFTGALEGISAHAVCTLYRR